MPVIVNPQWEAGWLQWGSDINFITKKAKEELEKMKKKHPDWNFTELAAKVRAGLIPARLDK